MRNDFVDHIRWSTLPNLFHDIAFLGQVNMQMGILIRMIAVGHCLVNHEGPHHSTEKVQSCVSRFLVRLAETQDEEDHIRIVTRIPKQL
jgi:hypothetical protein